MSTEESPGSSSKSHDILFCAREKNSTNRAANYLETADHNAIYTSKEIQNQMIVICEDIIRTNILQKVREARV